MLGIGLSNRLGTNEESPMPLSAYSLNSNFNQAIINPEEAYQNAYFMTRGIYILQEELDNQLAFAPLSIVQQLTRKDHQVTSIELQVLRAQDAEAVKASLQPVLEPLGLKAETRYEQNPTLYRVLQSERLAVFVILSFMLLIASFNIIGSLSMLVIEKEKDIAILQTMGMLPSGVQKIFLSTGVILSLMGALLGMFFAFVICFAQQKFGLIKLGTSGDFLIDAYPVTMRVSDFILVFLVVCLIALLASWFPAKKASQKNVLDNLRRNAA
jgi:lipoprotein-releasing system permease protein